MAAPPVWAMLLFFFFAAFAPAPATAAAARPAFPAGISPLRQRHHWTGRWAASAVAVAADGSGNATATAAKPFTTHYFPQELDHFTFTPNASRLFAQKYLLNDTFWRRPTGAAAAGPLFVYTGNEGDIEWFTTNTGFMFDIAPQFGALLVFIEHRFYGESMPFGNDSYKSAATLGYLTSTQALADFAVLITSLKHNLSVPDAPVVVFGGSYGGMLASWFRLKYPHVAMGALASSAPILQFDDITPWSSFYDAVSEDFKSELLACRQRGWGRQRNMSQTSTGSEPEEVTSISTWLEQRRIPRYLAPATSTLPASVAGAAARRPRGLLFCMCCETLNMKLSANISYLVKLS